MNLDMLAGLACIAIALALGALNAVSEHGLGWRLPSFVRRGLLVTALLMTFRGVDLQILAGEPETFHTRGHVDALAVLTSFSLAYTVISLTICLTMAARKQRRSKATANRILDELTTAK